MSMYYNNNPAYFIVLMMTSKTAGVSWTITVLRNAYNSIFVVRSILEYEYPDLIMLLFRFLIDPYILFRSGMEIFKRG